MLDDDLRQPLKRRRLSDKLSALKPSALQIATALTVVAGVGLAIWAVRYDDPLAGEPVVTVAVERSDPVITSSVKKPTEEAEPAEEPTPEEEVKLEPPPEDFQEVEIQEQAAILPATRMRLKPAPIRSVSQKTSLGYLPKIAKNGKKPWLVYARPVDRAVRNSTSPKIAIVLGGMGLNRQLTNQAINELPGEITLAFAPYGKGLQRQINSARKNGHEVMLQLPMEPFGYPTVDPGPKTLLVKDAPEHTLQNLKWHMSRFSGYIGVINYMGARFTAQGDGIGYVLRDISKRGLVYLDDGSSKRSVVPALGQVVKAPVRVTNMIIDSENSYNAISAALSRLEQQAVTDGIAIGYGSGLPLTVDAISSWARDLGSRNILLVPVSAAYRPIQS